MNLVACVSSTNKLPTQNSLALSSQSAAFRDPNLLRSQLEPWPTSTLRRRIVSDFHGESLDESVPRRQVMRTLLELYEKEVSERASEPCDRRIECEVTNNPLGRSRRDRL